MNKKIQCPYCFEKFFVEFIPEDGENQEVIYDCEVCCHPIEIKFSWNWDSQKLSVDIEKSSGFD